MQAYGRPSAAENIAEGNAIGSAQRAQAAQARGAQRTADMNSGTGQGNSLGRISAFDQYQQGPSRLDAFHTAPQGTSASTGTHSASMVPYNAGTPLSPAQGNALLGQDTSNISDGAAHDAGLAAAGKNQLTMTSYGQISSRNAQPGDTPAEGPSFVANNGVSNPGVVPAFNQPAAHAALYANPAMRGIFTAGTPENAAFVAHANQNGLQSAYQNANSIVQSARQPAPAAPTPQAAPALPAGAVAGAVAPMTASAQSLHPYATAPAAPQLPKPTANSNLGFMIGG